MVGPIVKLKTAGCAGSGDGDGLGVSVGTGVGESIGAGGVSVAVAVPVGAGGTAVGGRVVAVLCGVDLCGAGVLADDDADCVGETVIAGDAPGVVTTVGPAGMSTGVDAEPQADSRRMIRVRRERVGMSCFRPCKQAPALVSAAGSMCECLTC